MAEQVTINIIPYKYYCLYSNNQYFEIKVYALFTIHAVDQVHIGMGFGTFRSISNLNLVCKILLKYISF